MKCVEVREKPINKQSTKFKYFNDVYLFKNL